MKFFKFFKLSYYNKYKTYLRPDEDVVTSKISSVNKFIHIVTLIPEFN